MTIVSGSANAACGSATPSGLPVRPRFRTRMNSGRIATADREQQPEHEQREQRLAAAERIRAKTNAASDAKTTATTTAMTAITRLLPNSRQNVAALLAEQDLRVVLEDPRVGQDRARVGRQLAVGLEAAEDRVQDRDQDRRGDDHEDRRRRRRRAGAGARRGCRRAARRRRVAPTCARCVVAIGSATERREGALGVAPQHEPLVREGDHEAEQEQDHGERRCRSPSACP